MVSYRPVPDDRTEDAQRILDYAFELESGPQNYESGSTPNRLGELRGLFDDDEIVSVGTLYDFEARFRGDWIGLGGLGGIATPPEYRRKGRVRDLVRESLAEFRDREVPLVALWPFEHDFYRRLGWGTCQKYVEYELPPSALAFASEPDDGSFRRVGPDDWDGLQDVHLAAGEGATLSTRRTDDWWRHRFTDWGHKPYAYAYERDGTVEGYVVYTVTETADERRLNVWEVSVRDPVATTALLWFLHNHDSQVSTVRLYRSDTDLLDRATDAETVDCTVGMGPQVRIVDVVDALDAMPVPDREFDLRLAVSDPLAEWNDATFRIRTKAGHLSCRTSATGEPDATVDVSTLSQLIVGYFGVDDAERLAGLAVDGAETRAALSALFQPETVTLRELF
ncbi:MAG: enhanced intracellular survival protein Eis [Haloarculaceae archaeon]